MENTPVGTHCVLELFGVAPKRLNDLAFIRKAMDKAAKRANSTLLGFTHHQFEPMGVTAVALLAESHLSIHTWPENGYAAVDLFTCGEDCQPEKACAFLAKKFAARKHTLLVLQRGGDAVARLAGNRRVDVKEADLCQALR